MGLRHAALLTAALIQPAAAAAAEMPAPGAAPEPRAEAAAPPPERMAQGSTSPATPPASAPAAPAAPRPRFLLSGSLRLRQEGWDWFGSGDAGRYTFTGSMLRIGGTYSGRRSDAMLELEQPMLLNLPHDATLAPPLGQLGHGASYRDANGSQEASLFIKQAFWRVKGLAGPANSARLGRFEFVDGAETTPKDPSLAWLKRERIAHRLLGTFGFTHVGRSFDGGQFVHNAPKLNVTLFGGMPTEGVFDLDGGATLDDIHVGYAAVTRPFGGGRYRAEGRLFGLYYRDDRKGVVKSDNRSTVDPAALAADQAAIGVTTLGGHYTGLWESGAGKIDLLAWGAGQFGDWGRLSHEAFAGALEAGWQPKKAPGSPWLRVGYYYATGDNDPADGDHKTFFPVLPTPRIYARFPFYTLTNIQDLFAQAIVRPHRRWTLRADAHRLSLASEKDLWYAGGGAFNRPTFGYGGRPSGGASTLATLVDLSADYQAGKNTTVSLYLGHAFGGNVIDNLYPGSSSGSFGYLEFTRRY
jgi:hypothetical protein